MNRESRYKVYNSLLGVAGVALLHKHYEFSQILDGLSIVWICVLLLVPPFLLVRTYH